jgi:hypothetical protein
LINGIEVGIFQGFASHPIRVALVDRKKPPQHEEEKQKEDHKRDNGPDGDIIDALKNILVHMLFSYRLLLLLSL